MQGLNRFFRLDENRTTVWTETRAGVVTFMAMAYIIFVQPIIIGTLMMRSVSAIEWTDVTESVPAFLTLAIIPLAFSITDGIAFGFISYAGLKLVRGRGREVNGLVYLFSVLFLGLYVLRSFYAARPAG